MPASPVRSSGTPPNAGTLAPHTPLAAADRGDRHAGTGADLRTAATSAGVEGRATAAGRAGTAPSTAQASASGHQSRPASMRACSLVSTVGADALQPGQEAVVDWNLSVEPGGVAGPACGVDLDGNRRPARWGHEALAALVLLPAT